MRTDKLTLAADNLHVIKHYVDISFAVHPDFKSHTGKNSTMGTGCFDGMYRKQKINTRSIQNLKWSEAMILQLMFCG